MWPMKSIMLNAQRPREVSCDGRIKPMQHALYFGDINSIAGQLHVANRLSGYVFVLDASGLVRWRDSGQMLDRQSSDLVEAVLKLTT
jgi:ATP10 protein